MTDQDFHLTEEYEDGNLERHVRGLSEETYDAEFDEPDPPSPKYRSDVDMDSVKKAVNGRLEQLLDEETVGHSLSSIGQDLRTIFESPIAGLTISEVADRINTIMTSAACLRNVQALQMRIKIILMSKNAPQNVREAVDRIVQFVTDRQNLPKVQEKCENVIDLIHFLSSGSDTFEEVKRIIELYLGDTGAEHKISGMWGSIHMLADIDPSKTMRGITARIPGLTFSKLSSILH